MKSPISYFLFVCLFAVLHPTREFFTHMKTSSPTVTRGIRSGAATACCYYLSLSRLGFEHPAFRLRGERSVHMTYISISEVQ